MQPRHVDARFIDFYDYRATGVRSYNPGLPGWAIFLIVVAAVVAALLILKGSLMLRKHLRKLREKKVA
jgi:hypothetical protein